MRSAMFWKRWRDPAASGFSWRWPDIVEAALLVLLVVQVVRLVWVAVTPVSPLGQWEPRKAAVMPFAERIALFRSYDPFYPASASNAGSGVVTSLPIKLFGLRINEGSGLGSAIVAGPDGVQNSFAVGDEIMPGVVLKAVAFDHVVISRGGTDENVFLDQSQSAPVADPSGAAPSDASSSGLTSDMLRNDIGLAPRIRDGRVTGVVLSKNGDAFGAAGFQPGDVITQINGRPVTAADDVAALRQSFAPGAHISLTVERGAGTVPITLSIPAP